MIDVHVTAPFRILRAAAEPLRTFAQQEAAEGREVIRKVVNVSSMAGSRGNPGQVNYSSAKAAMIGMTKKMCKERSEEHTSEHQYIMRISYAVLRLKKNK